jgi:hypothetical protein
MVKMRAADTLFISSVSSENIPPNGEFEVGEEQAEDLAGRGLATRVKAVEAAPENKMEAAPANKTRKRGK